MVRYDSAGNLHRRKCTRTPARGAMITMLPYLGFVALPIAVILLWVGWRGRRINDVPHCRRCGFDLRATWPGRTRCPECGAELARSRRAVRHGERERRVMPILIGSLAVFVFLVWEVYYIRAWIGTAQRTTIATTSSLVRQTESVEAGTRAAALRELERRLEAGELDSALIAQLVDRSLAVQASADPGWDPEWGTFFESAWLDAHVSDEQARRYTRQLATFNAALRADILPYQDGLAEIVLELDNVRAGWRMSFELVTVITCFELAGREIEVAPREMYSTVSPSAPNQTNVIGQVPLAAEDGVQPFRLGVSMWLRSISTPALEMPAVDLNLTSSVVIEPRPAGMPLFVCDEGTREQVIRAFDISLAAVPDAPAPWARGNDMTSARMLGYVAVREPGVWVPYEYEFVPNLAAPWRNRVSAQYASPTGSMTTAFGRNAISLDDRVDFRAWPASNLADYVYREADQRVWYGPVVIPDVPVTWYESLTDEDFPFKRMAAEWLEDAEERGGR